ncbi:MAG: amidohydrolase family protein, partial [Saprospiraceae bacterium]|nr:amidohydrolase family protein [Saprospiraceae bacterium]
PMGHLDSSAMAPGHFSFRPFVFKKTTISRIALPLHIKHQPAMVLRLTRFFLFFLMLAAAPLAAQSPTPAPAQKTAILIMGATAHLGNGTVIQNSAIAFENGKLTLVTDASTARIDRTKYGKIFDAVGKQVYPGFIATNSQLGLVEIDAARSTVDFAETGSLNPNARTIIAYNTDSEVPPTVRTSGVLLAQIVPSGGILSGTSSVVQLDAWNWEDAAYRMDDGVHLNWPVPRNPPGAEPGPTLEAKRTEQYEKDVLALRRFLEEARGYAQQAAVEVKNPKFEAMRGVFAQKQNLYIHVNTAKGIQESILFAEQFGLRPVLVEAGDAWLVADFLKAHNVSVILAKTQRLPTRDDEDVDQSYKTATVLQEKGVLFAFSEEGNWRQRNLAFQAGQAVGYGLPYEAALSALTLNTAKILGIDATVGSLEIGKDATLFISEGDVLDMRTAQVTAAFIQGREINLDNKQKELYRKYEQKYKQ